GGRPTDNDFAGSFYDDGMSGRMAN
ncbi:hypothetical protein SNEBB_008151, partial [Seison nebaliae]